MLLMSRHLMLSILEMQLPTLLVPATQVPTVVTVQMLTVRHSQYLVSKTMIPLNLTATSLVVMVVLVMVTPTTTQRQQLLVTVLTVQSDLCLILN